jgi:putative Mg2+ transporter-C (MgtC) family protein
MDAEHLLLRLALAAFLGSVVGFERERLDWAAGLRDHMLVCLGAALFMIVSCYGFGGVVHPPEVVLDPSRVAAQVVSGIGFLGAGTILVRGEIIKGLTTAASLWAIAAVGLAAGGGLYLPAISATVLYLIILAGMKPIEKRLFNGRKNLPITVSIALDRLNIGAIEAAIRDSGSEVSKFQIRIPKNPDQREVELLIKKCKPEQRLRLIESLHRIPGVVEVTHRPSEPSEPGGA